MGSLTFLHTAKIKLVSVFFLLAFAAAIFMLAHWQVFASEQFEAIANQRYSFERIPSVRGAILADDNSTLAYTERRFNVFVWLPELEAAEKNSIQTRREFVDKVAALLLVEPAEIEAKLNSDQKWIKLATKVDGTTRGKLMDLRRDNNPEKHLIGLKFENADQRIYPEHKLASHVLGFVGSNTGGQYVGVSGLEQYWEGSLKAIEGIESGEFDSFGNPIVIVDSLQLEPQPGVTLHTTIDKNLQTILEAKLKQGQEQFKSKSVTGIIVDPKTGKVLAMAHYPDYDPNKYYEVTDGEVFRNGAIAQPYEIGSVGKVFTAAAALDTGAVTPDQIILPNGHNGCEIITPNVKEGATCKDKDIECICTYDSKKRTMAIDVTEAMTSSDNIALRHIAMSISYQDFQTYLSRFGVGEATRIDIAGEAGTPLKGWQDWNYADQAVYSYGHGYVITPLQAIMGVAAVANDGKRMQPYVVSKVVDADDNVEEFSPIIVEQAIKPETAAMVTSMMNKVYLGTLYESRFKGLNKYNIAVKSGTALIPYRDRAGYSNEINATYVGFDASPKKTFVMLIRLEEPQNGDLSFNNTRILWLDTFVAIKDYLAVPEFGN